MDEEWYDYATYSVGSYNSDMREEFSMYYSNILKPYLLSDDKTKAIQEKINELNSYLDMVNNIEINTKILKLAIDNPDIKSNPILLNKANLAFHKEFNKLKELPKKLLNNREYQMLQLDLTITKSNIENMILSLSS